MVLYTGTFEAYQGLDLLFAAMAHVRSRMPDARLLMAGGKSEQVEKARGQARAAGIEDVAIFAGERPSTEIPAYLRACDVLVSPRSRGTNTPLKIYQYLRSGKPIVATRLLTHTQVLSDDTAILTGPTGRGLRRGHCRGAAGLRRGRRWSGSGRASWPRRNTATRRISSGRDRRARRCSRTVRRRQPSPRRRQVRERTSRERSAVRDHYSYSVYADPATAQNFDERRFGGPIGQMVADVAGGRDRCASRPDPRSDDSRRRDGNGPGRHAAWRVRAPVSPASIRRRRCWPSRGGGRPTNRCRFGSTIGDAHRLEFADRAFDVVISLRVLMHAADWQGCLAELCRVSDRLVIIDYPSARSVALLQSLGRRLVHRFGARTEPYRVLSDATVARELERAGFRIRAAASAVRAADCGAQGDWIPADSRSGTRALSERLGLLRLFGSPVTVVAERW